MRTFKARVNGFLGHPVVQWSMLAVLLGLSVWALRTGYRTETATTSMWWALLTVTSVIALAKVRNLLPRATGLTEIVETVIAPLLIIVPIILIEWYTDSHDAALMFGTLFAALYGFMMGLVLKPHLGEWAKRLDRPVDTERREARQ